MSSALVLSNSAPKSGGLFLSRLTKEILREQSDQPIIELTDGLFAGEWPNARPLSRSWDALRANNDAMFFCMGHFLPDAVVEARPDFLILHFRSILDSVVSWMDHVDSSLARNRQLNEIAIPYTYRQSWREKSRDLQEIDVVSSFGLDLIRYLSEWVEALPTLREGPPQQGARTSARTSQFHGIPVVISSYTEITDGLEALTADIAHFLDPGAKRKPEPSDFQTLKTPENNFNVGVRGRGETLSETSKKFLSTAARANNCDAWL